MISFLLTVDHLFLLFAGQIPGPIVSHVHSLVRGGMGQGELGQQPKMAKYIPAYINIAYFVSSVPAQGFLFDMVWVE